MKKIKYLAFVMSVVTFLSLVGVGFSIWYNVDVILPNGDGTVTDNNNVITAYAVDQSSNILYCKGTIEVFQYSALSFSDGDTGKITATYWIDTNSEFITDSTTLTFSLTTEENTTKGNAGLFGAVDGTTKSFSASINNSVDLGNATVSTDGKMISFTCTYGAISELVQANDGNFTLTYTLNIPKTYSGGTTVGNFRKAFGQYLLSNLDSDGDGTGDITTKFIVIAGVTIS
ncbi:MAG: hypothetical protein IJF33_00245 [Clostridia bacterium]|nr:hypothetical protein [Clostridia bacterium]